MAKKSKTLKLVRPAKITKAAHEATPELCAIYAKELGLSEVSQIEAISKAIFEALERRKAQMVPA